MSILYCFKLEEKDEFTIVRDSLGQPIAEVTIHPLPQREVIELMHQAYLAGKSKGITEKENEIKARLGL